LASNHSREADRFVNILCIGSVLAAADCIFRLCVDNVPNTAQLGEPSDVTGLIMRLTQPSLGNHLLSLWVDNAP